jgi:nucleoside-diphosphate-sugar epimerase
MKFLVFGATGMLGSMFCKVASQAGHKVFAVDNPEFAHFDRISSYENVTALSYDDLKKNSLKVNVALDFSWIGISCEQRYDIDIQVQNIQLFLMNYNLALISGVKKLVVAGSVYESSEYSAYGLTKKYIRSLGRYISEKNCVGFVWGQIFSIYGPNAFKGSLLDSMLKGKVDQINNGKQIWNWLHTYDAATAFLAIATFSSDNKHFWVANPQTETLGYYTAIVNQLMPPEHVIRIDDGRGNTDIPIPDVTPLLELGWKPNYTFEQGIAELLKKP